MPRTIDVEIVKLKLDLNNFRTMPQKNEADAIAAMISIKPDRFFGVMESILEDGYLKTENLVVIEKGSDLIVREGNRRLAVLKLIHGEFNLDDFLIPPALKDKIRSIDKRLKKSMLKVPCSVYGAKESETVERIVALTHAKGEKASRDPWSSVAKARYDRDVKKVSTPQLDILEKYLEHGSNLTGQQKSRWSGDYPITVLQEALGKIYARLDQKSIVELASNYPKIPQRTEFEEILSHIGLELLSFEKIRKPDFPDMYGIKATVSITTPLAIPPAVPPGKSKITPPVSTPAKSAPPKAYATNDPRHVIAILKLFSPKGSNRQKVATLRGELLKIKVKDNPIAFCLLLRSIFEISAKIYCNENGISITKSNNGRSIEKTLVEVLNEITKQLTNNNSNAGMVKLLHGAVTEMSQPNRILSVTSMNQLVHSQGFTVSPSDVCTLFGNVYPLLEAMN